jgi:hypothetical protein
MNELESKYYTTLQYQEYSDENENSLIKTESNKVFAKAIKSGLSRDINTRGPSRYKYYVRIFPNKKLYDPFPKYSYSTNKDSFLDKVCKSETGYREVPFSVFDKYLNFLRTENSQWLTSAQKEANDL